MVDSILYAGHEDETLRAIGEAASLWIHGESDENEINSFAYLCLQLGTVPETFQELTGLMIKDEVRRLRGIRYAEDT